MLILRDYFLSLLGWLFYINYITYLLFFEHFTLPFGFFSSFKLYTFLPHHSFPPLFLPSSLPPGVTFGFKRALYTVGEGDGTVSVCVVIVNGELARPATVELSSQDNTATGTYIIIFISSQTHTKKWICFFYISYYNLRLKIFYIKIGVQSIPCKIFLLILMPNHYYFSVAFHFLSLCLLRYYFSLFRIFLHSFYLILLFFFFPSTSIYSSSSFSFFFSLSFPPPRSFLSLLQLQMIILLYHPVL